MIQKLYMDSHIVDLSLKHDTFIMFVLAVNVICN